MKDIISDIHQALEDSADEKTIKTGQRFFKEEIKFHGVRIPLVHKVGNEYFEQIKDKPKKEIFALCEELWKTGYSEEAYIACDWSYFVRESFEPADFKVFEKWVNLYVSNWATCDTLCNHTVGAFVEKYPEFVSELKQWARSENRWVKRAAAVTLIIPARKGLLLKDIFEIADILLLDSDDMVQKGYGWMLKAASEAYQQEVYDYVISKRLVMPRTSLRYAIEKMPHDLRVEAMKK